MSPDEDADDKAGFDPGAIEIGPRPERPRDAPAPTEEAAPAPGRLGRGDGQRTMGLVLVVLAGVALFAGGALIYAATQRLPSRLPAAQLRQVLDAARWYLRVAAYAMMGGGFVALLGWRMLVASGRKARARG